MHALSHGLGLDVHDPWPAVMEPGVALTIEPGIYVRPNLFAEVIPDTPANREMRDAIRPAFERYAGIGVRIEDDYVITAEGVERISLRPEGNRGDRGADGGAVVRSRAREPGVGRMVPRDAVIGLSAGRLARRSQGLGSDSLGGEATAFSRSGQSSQAPSPERGPSLRSCGDSPSSRRRSPSPSPRQSSLGVVLRQVVGAGRGLARVRARRDPFLPAVGRGGLRLAQDTGLLVFLFYLLWGVQYARPGLETHLGIEPAGEATTPELRALAEHAVRHTNEAYEELHGSPDIGEPTPPQHLGHIVPSLEIGWERIGEVLNLPERVAKRYGAPKKILATPLVKRLGISGIYFPYTAEALVLNDLPGVLLGKELGHEMSHQRGFSSESDANVLGTLVALHSRIPSSATPATPSSSDSSSQPFSASPRPMRRK